MTRVHCMLRLNNESIQVGPNQWAPIWWTNANSVEEFDTHQAHDPNLDAFKVRIPKTAQYRVECGVVWRWSPGPPTDRMVKLGTIQPEYPHGYPFGPCGVSELSAQTVDTLQGFSRLIRLAAGIALSLLIYHSAPANLTLGTGTFLEIREEP